MSQFRPPIAPVLSIIIGAGMLAAMALFRFVPDLPFAVIPAGVLLLILAFRRQLETAFPQPPPLRLPAWRLICFLALGIILPTVLFWTTNLGPSVWPPLLLISQYFLAPGVHSRLLSGLALLMLNWACLSSGFPETNFIVFAAFALALVIHGETERKLAI